MIPQKPFITLHEENVNPLSSLNTQLVAAFLSCGGRLMPMGYSCYETNEDNGSKSLHVKYHLEDMTIEFKTNDGPSKIRTADFIRLWNDHEWHKKHADHPYAYIRCFVTTQAKCRDNIRALGSQFHKKRGVREVFIDPRLPEDKKKKFMDAFNAP